MTALAHNNKVHADMTDLAWQTMRLAALIKSQQNPCAASLAPGAAPAGISDADWQDFLGKVAAAVPRLERLPAELPPPVCSDSGGKALSSQSWPTLGDVSQAVGHDYLTEVQKPACGQRDASGKWRPGGIFNQLPHGKKGSPTGSAWTGLALGVHAQRPDDDEDDMRVGVRPLGVFNSTVGQFVDKAFKIGADVLLAPFVCLFDLFRHHKSCLDDTKNVVDTIDPAQVDGFLPVVGELSHLGGTGFSTTFHFVNIQAGRSEFYDSPQGLLYEEAGLHGVPDGVDVAIMIATDGLGTGFGAVTTNYDKSDGPKNYEAAPPYDDGVRPTKHRTKAQWQSTNFGHTAFEPLDNLAYYGWSHFVADPAHSARWLSWPLHGMGDAVAPHHIIGSTGWGHRPFENAVEHRWSEIRWQESNEGIENNAPDFVSGLASETGIDIQNDQVQLILQHARQYHLLIEQWRASGVSPDPRDIPIRQLVVQIARDTDGFLNNDQEPVVSPFNPGISTQFMLGGTDVTEHHYDNDGATKKDSYVHMMRGLIERGAGATIALLMAASDFAPPGAVGDPDTTCFDAYRPCSTCSDCPAEQGCVPGTTTVCGKCTSDADCCDKTCDTTGACVGKPPPVAPCQTCADCINNQVCLSQSCAPCLSDAQCCQPGDVCSAGECLPNIK
jgi:hypothetical protein